MDTMWVILGEEPRTLIKMELFPAQGPQRCEVEILIASSIEYQI